MLGDQYSDCKQFTKHQVTKIFESIVQKEKQLEKLEAFNILKVSPGSIKQLLATDLSKFVKNTEISTN